jgi:hypothetical protein
LAEPHLWPSFGCRVRHSKSLLKYSAHTSMTLKLGTEKIKAINDGGLRLEAKAKFKTLPHSAQKQLRDANITPVFSIDVFDLKQFNLI